MENGTVLSQSRASKRKASVLVSEFIASESRTNDDNTSTGPRGLNLVEALQKFRSWATDGSGQEKKILGMFCNQFSENALPVSSHCVPLRSFLANMDTKRSFM